MSSFRVPDRLRKQTYFLRSEREALDQKGARMETRERDNPTRLHADRRFSRREALRGAGAAGMALAGAGHLPGVASATQAVDENDRPNILVIIVDEMRDWQWFPEQEQLNEAFPAMARLQDGAVRFGRHYTASNMCTPSRGSLLTGLYSHQTGLVLTQGASRDNLDAGLSGGTPDAATPVEEAPPWPPLDPRFPTWGTLLRQQGYETYWYGKWHVNDDSCDMEQYGFAGGTCPSPNGGPGEGQVKDPEIADQAIDWLQNQRGEAPWCTTVSFINPHDIQWYPRQSSRIEGQNNPPAVFDAIPPNYETSADLARERKPRLQLVTNMALPQVFGDVPHRGPNFEQGWITMLDLYHQLHAYVDTEIGRLLDALEAQPEVAANTIIVFTSDHGEYCGSHGLRGKGAGVYEEGIRIPLWVKDPTGRFVDRPEVTRTQFTSSVDITPMLLTIACGGNDWRDDEELSHLANRLDLTALLGDAEAPGRDYIVHATDEDGFEFGPRLFPFLQDAPFHVLGLITEDAKLGVYTDWADTSDDILTESQEVEFYDYATDEGRLELANTADSENPRFREMYQFLMTEAVPNELRAPLPEALEAARAESMAATVKRIAYDRAMARG